MQGHCRAFLLGLSCLCACGGLRGDAERQKSASSAELALANRVERAPLHARPQEPDLPAEPTSAQVTSTALQLTAEHPAEQNELEIRDEQPSFDAKYPLYGVAFHMQAQVYEAPTDSAAVVGYFRRGGLFRAKPGVRGKGCDTLWHALLGGGYVCAGRGFLLGKTPQSFAASPAAPSLQDDLPYPYGKTLAHDVPQYWKLPSAVEERDTLTQLTQLRPGRMAEASELARKSESPVLAAKNAVALPPAAAGAGAPLPSLVRIVMQPGFYVSIDGEEQDGERSLTRTVRGAYVRAGTLTPVVIPPLHGHELNSLGSRDVFPLALAYRANAPSYHRDPQTGALLRGEGLTLMQAMTLTHATLLQGGRRYLLARDGLFVPEDAVRIVTPAQRPPLVPSRAHWIDISLENQTLVAYEGDVPVFATLVSTGREDHDTPTGIFRIQSKHVSATMDGEAGSDEAYSIEDVPWTMYFQGNYALHAAFWHKQFGRVRSHGCVNLAPADARHLFEWSTPGLPNGFHGVLATRDNPGTWVVIHP